MPDAITEIKSWPPRWLTAVNDTAKVVFGADSQAVQSASHSEPLAPQSESIDTSKVHWSSMCL